MADDEIKYALIVRTGLKDGVWKLENPEEPFDPLSPGSGFIVRRTLTQAEFDAEYRTHSDPL